MTDNLDAAMWAAWQSIESRVLGNDIDLRRRLDRRAKMFQSVPRPLCLAIKASDHRITEMSDHLSDRHDTDKGNETEHDVLLPAHTIKDLCRPVELYWGQAFRKLAGQLGAPRQVPRRLEQRGILRARRIAKLGGQRGLPVPLVDSPVPATAAPDARQWEHYGCEKLLDPGAWGYTAPDKLLAPYWHDLSLRLPDWFAQTLRRQPVFRVHAGHLRFMHWVWLCPQCNRQVNTIYLPLGASDFAAMHNIKLQNDPLRHADSSIKNQKSKIENLPSLACQRCHHIFGLARTPKSISKTWSLLIAHISGGLLFGREVKRPASFSAIRKNKYTGFAAPRPSPRRDELEAYLAHTDFPLTEIARRMGWTYASVNRELHVICKKRHLKANRPTLKRWWSRHPAQSNMLSAA